MQANNRVEVAPGRTVTETARRAQIVRAAIDTIAQLGYRNASFAQIARRAGLSSTGLISYHFESRDELIQQVVTQVVSEISAYMAERMTGAANATEALRTYIEGNVEFIGAHREEMKALLEIFLNGGLDYGPATEQMVLSPVQDILRRGQESGEFRRFDPRVMATLIQRAVDGLPFLLAADPHLDIRAYGAEVATVFHLATKTGT
jgi:AcrR family transcriptional regulator